MFMLLFADFHIYVVVCRFSCLCCYLQVFMSMDGELEDDEEDVSRENVEIMEQENNNIDQVRVTPPPKIWKC